MKQLVTILLIFGLCGFVKANDNIATKQVYDFMLTESDCYENLRSLCKDIGPRLSGSEGAAKAVEWAVQRFQEMGVSKVEKQSVMVPHWVRHQPAKAKIIGDQGFNLAVCALGGSVGTPKEGITAEVVEVKSLEECAKLGEAGLKGKIVFFNRPMNPYLINTFHAYSGCVDQRGGGASSAAPFGAVAVLVRSMNLRVDDLPHTGVMNYAEGVTKIPAASISTKGAADLKSALAKNPKLKVQLNMYCENFPDAPSHNVIAEIKGSEFPNEVILVGGHLDSWDLGEGAHDDGAGVVQSMEVLNYYLKKGIQPKRTIRCVLFMNEENGSRGAQKYAQEAINMPEKHIVAIESDRGGFTPRGFTIDGASKEFASAEQKIGKMMKGLTNYDVHVYQRGFSGVDINYLKPLGVTLLGYVPDSQRYFDHHHANNDVFEAVNERELELGAATITSLIGMIDAEGLPIPTLPETEEK